MRDLRRLGEGLNLVFSTPIAIVKWPEAEWRSQNLVALAERIGFGPVPGNDSKLETSNQLQMHQNSDLDCLVRFIESSAMDMAETLTGSSLGKSLQAAHLAQTAAYRSNDTVQRNGIEPRLKVCDVWMNCYEAGHFHPPHSHPKTLLAAVYILSVPENLRPPQGSISFQDPRRDSVNHSSGLPLAAEGMDIIYSGRPGDLVIFPGWLTHYVFPHRELGRRITLSANIVLDQASHG